MNEAGDHATGQDGIVIRRGRARGSRLLRRLFWAWALSSLMVAGSLALAHDYALPMPPRDAPLVRAAVAGSRSAAEQRQWLALHVLYTRCKCSERTLAHLFARGPLAGMKERVVLVGAHPEFERKARAAGFAVEVVKPAELELRYHVQGAPLMLVSDPEGELRYLGGYTETKQAYALHDVEIITALRRGDAPRELPLLGCAVSRSLQALFDPLGLKRRDGEG